MLCLLKGPRSSNASAAMSTLGIQMLVFQVHFPLKGFHPLAGELQISACARKQGSTKTNGVMSQGYKKPVSELPWPNLAQFD